MTLIVTQLGYLDPETMTIVKRIRGLPNARYFHAETGTLIPPLEKVKHRKEPSSAPVQDDPEPVQDEIETPEPELIPEIETPKNDEVPSESEDDEKDRLIDLLATKGIDKDRRSSIKTLRKLAAPYINP